MKFFTSHNLGEGEIQKHLGLVTSQYVIGANFFKDFLGGISDIFGGQNDGYKNVLKNLEKAALKEISEQTEALGGNAVIGLNIDQDEVSGGGKSMFMIKVYGTAVLLNHNENIDQSFSTVFTEEHYQAVVDHNEAIEYLKLAPKERIITEAQNAIRKLKINLFPSEEVYRLLLNTGLSMEVSSSKTFLTQLQSVPANYLKDYIDGLLSQEQPIGSHYLKKMANYCEEKNTLPVDGFSKAIEGEIELKILKYIHLLNNNILGYAFNDSYYQDLNKLVELLEVHQSTLQDIARQSCPTCSKQKMKDGRCRNCNRTMHVEPIIEGYKEHKEVLDILFANKDRFI